MPTFDFMENKPSRQRSACYRLFNAIGLPYENQSDTGPAWDGKILHTKRIATVALPHEAAHWLVASKGEDYRKYPNYGLGPDLEHPDEEVETLLGDDMEDEILASALGIVIGTRLGMDIDNCLRLVIFDQRFDSCRDSFADLEDMQLTPLFLKKQLESFPPRKLTRYQYQKPYVVLANGGTVVEAGGEEDEIEPFVRGLKRRHKAMSGIV